MFRENWYCEDKESVIFGQVNVQLSGFLFSYEMVILLVTGSHSRDIRTCFIGEFDKF